MDGRALPKLQGKLMEALEPELVHGRPFLPQESVRTYRVSFTEQRADAIVSLHASYTNQPADFWQKLLPIGIAGYGIHPFAVLRLE